VGRSTDHFITLASISISLPATSAKGFTALPLYRTAEL